jgi:hypothetical protein
LNKTLSNTKTVTPFEHWYGVQPDISNLHVFGSVSYFLVADDLRQKLDPKATKGAYVSESEEQKANRVFMETTGRTHITRHVRVYENLPYWPLAIEPAPSVAEQPPSPLIDDITPEATIHPLTSTSALGTKTPRRSPARPEIRQRSHTEETFPVVHGLCHVHFFLLFTKLPPSSLLLLYLLLLSYIPEMHLCTVLYRWR